jgi:CRP/FNR family transcriptional regulator
MTMSQAGEPNEHPCAECSIRRLSVCAALDKADLRELVHLSRHIHFAAGETVFSQEEMTTSFYNLLEGVIRLYKLLPDGRRQIIGFALPGDFLGLSASVRHNISPPTRSALWTWHFLPPIRHANQKGTQVTRRNRDHKRRSRQRLACHARRLRR